MRKLSAVFVAVTILLLSNTARGEPLPTKASQFQTITHCTTTGGTDITLPPGWWLVPPDTWNALDLKLKNFQLDKVRLTAENSSLKTSLRKFKPRWYWLTAAYSLGFGFGQAYAWWRNR